jgi:hypothetical protein
MTREQFMLDTIARLIDEGLDLRAARLHAAAIVATCYVESQLTDKEWAADHGEAGVYG